VQEKSNSNTIEEEKGASSGKNSVYNFQPDEPKIEKEDQQERKFNLSAVSESVREEREPK
jgi:hypothetical protein